MSLKKKTGMFLLLCCMAAIVAVTWYCLLTVGRKTSHIDGTFVVIPTVEKEIAA